MSGLGVFILSAFLQIAPRSFPAPPPTDWHPEGCRVVPYRHDVLGERAHWRMLHADAVNTDEVALALPAMLEPDWVAEPLTLNITGPVFDAQGNLYFSPSFPDEKVILISVEPVAGARRFAIPGLGAGGGPPTILMDPARPGREVVYVGTYERVVAVETDGTMVWDVPTGLTANGTIGNAVFGLNYHPGADALVGLTADGHLFAHDRTTGAPLLPPHSLPGSPAPPSSATSLPDALVQAWIAELDPLMDIPPTLDPRVLLDVILGGSTEAANFFSVDPATGGMWVAATAPDWADGKLDGVSELGALYRLELSGGPSWSIRQTCHRYFNGGSASTPALRADGSRVYVADAAGLVFALDGSCGDVWSYDVGDQVVGSIGVASDGGEVYVATGFQIVKLTDLGATVVEEWRSDLEVYLTPPGQTTFNLDLYSIGANGVGFQAGAGVATTTQGLPLEVGVGVLDRLTGEVRAFTDGFEETVAAMSTGPDGSIYMGHSPIRTAFSRVLFPASAPALIGGIGKYRARRVDLQVRDGAVAGADRLQHAAEQSGPCPAAAQADLEQGLQLIDQARASTNLAVNEGTLTPNEASVLDGAFDEAQLAVSMSDPLPAAGALRAAARFSDRRPTALLTGEGFGATSANRFRLFNPLGMPTGVDVSAYGAGAWGTAVAGAALSSRAADRVVTGPGPGAVYGPHVRGFASDGSPLAPLNFYAYGTLKYGVKVAAADHDADGYDVLLTAAGPGLPFGPHLRAFRFDGRVVAAERAYSFYAFGTLHWGAEVTAGDITFDGAEEVIAGPGPGPSFSANVRGFVRRSGRPAAMPGVNFVAHSTRFGVVPGASDVDRDGAAELLSTPGPDPIAGARYLGFDVGGGPVSPLPGFDLSRPSLYGGRVAAADLRGRGASDLASGLGPDPAAGSWVRTHRYVGSALVLELDLEAFPGNAYGVVVSGLR